MLRAHYKSQCELRLALGQGSKPKLVFNDRNGNPMGPHSVSQLWRLLCICHKLSRVPFHALRHTHVSILIAKGVDILTISRRLGHSKASVTLDIYSHLLPGADKAAADAMEGMF
jgi:integrase